MREVSAALKAEYARYRELLSLTRVRTKLSPEVETRLRKGKALCDLFIQDKNTLVSTEEQVIVFYAFNKSIPEILDEDKRDKFKSEVFDYLRRERPQLIDRLTTQRTLTEDIKRELDEAFQKFFYT